MKTSFPLHGFLSTDQYDNSRTAHKPKNALYKTLELNLNRRKFKDKTLSFQQVEVPFQRYNHIETTKPTKKENPKQAFSIPKKLAILQGNEELNETNEKRKKEKNPTKEKQIDKGNEPGCCW